MPEDTKLWQRSLATSLLLSCGCLGGKHEISPVAKQSHYTAAPHAVVSVSPYLRLFPQPDPNMSLTGTVILWSHIFTLYLIVSGKLIYWLFGTWMFLEIQA